MSAAPEVINPQNVTEIAQCWNGTPLVRKDSGKGPSPARLISGEASSSGDDEFNTKVRKPYTITKQRERWTESEHQKFLEALKLYGRAWRRIEEYIGTKTAVQIRSHAQKFFSKLEREASTGSSAGKIQDIEIPPPRPKRKPSHPYPKKAGNSVLNLEDENKESSSLSSPGLPAVHHEGFKSGSFNPYVSKGLGSAFHPSPLVPGHFFGPKGMKLFGKTVVVPKTPKPASQNNASKEGLVGEEIPSPDTQTNKADLKQFAGFSPFLKVRKNDENFSEAPLHSDRNGSEGTGVSLARTCRDDGSAGTDEPEAADAQFLGRGKEQQRRSRVDASLRKIENISAFPQKDGEKVDVQFPHGVHQNNLMHHWIDNFVHYHSSLPIPPMAAHGLADGVPADPLTYWQCMQASAVNYAAYTAAMAAAAVAGWTGSIAGGRESTEALQTNDSEAQVLSSFDKALPSATPSWWPFRGFIPPGHCPPSREGEDMDIAANANPLGYAKKNGTFEEISVPGETVTDLEMADEGETSELFSKVDDDDGKEHTEFSPSAKSGCMLGTSCVTEAPGSESALPDSESHHEADATIMLVKCSTQESDTERRADIEPLQNLYSSSDEFEGQGKKPGEGSSSGSNTPASRFQSNEFDAPTMLQSKKRDSYTLFEDNDDTYSDAFKKSLQQCVVNTIESPKIRLKHAEKARKNQQKDSRHSDDSKRLKSCAHELELRKEVSQEGRKAFQALFTSKLLPQAFPAANMAEDRDVSFRTEHISRLTVSKNEPGSINVPVPIERASDECVNTGGSPRGKINGEVHICGNKLSATGANLEMGIGYGVLDSQHGVDSKSFTVSSSSGFVPYRRPL